MVRARNHRQTLGMPTPDASLSLRARVTALCLRVCFPLAGVFLLTLGLLGLLSYGVLPLADAWRARNWQPVPAVLEHVALRPETSPLHPPLDSVQVVFRYQAAGAEHVGQRLDPHDGRFPRSHGNAVIDVLRGQAELVAWVNPADPAEAMLARELRWTVLVFALPALAMMVVGALLLFGGMLAWNNVAARPGGRRAA